MNDEDRDKTEEKTAGNKDQGKGSDDGVGKSRKYPVLSGYGPPEASKDPLVVLKEILKDENLDEQGKEWLLEYSVTRFKNRRRMAYWALSAILVSLAFLLLASIIDGQSTCILKNECTGILKSLSEIQGLLEWIEGFLAAIVATYYGMSSFRPSS